MNKKVVKNLYGKTASVLNESLVKDTAALLGVEEGDVSGAIDALSFADYLQLGNAVDIGDADTVREMLDISGVDSSEEFSDDFGGDELDLEEPVEEAFHRSIYGRMADENKARLKKEKDRERLEKKLAKAEWDRKYGTPKKVSKKALYGEFADKILSAISNAFPDGDPMDYFVGYMQRNGLTMDDAEKAMKQATGRSYDHYLIDMWDSFAADSVHDANMYVSQGQDPGDSPFWTWQPGEDKVTPEPNPWGTYKKRKKNESLEESDEDDWDWEDDERNEQVTQYYEAMDGSVFLDPDFKGISSLEIEDMYRAADMAVRKKARSKGQSHPEVKELYKNEVKLLNEISWRTVYAEKQVYGNDWKGEEYDASWTDDEYVKEAVDYDQHEAPGQVVKIEPGKGLGRPKIYVKLLKGKHAGKLASFLNTMSEYTHPTYYWHRDLRVGDKIPLILSDMGYYVLPHKRKAVTESDNPYVSPPSQGMASSSNIAKKDDESNLVKRKDVDDLMFGDEVEVADVDGQPTAAKVIMPKGPGNTVVVKGKGGNEVILKKDSVIGTPKVNESARLAGWRIEDKSKLGGGADPTWITRWILRSGNEYLEIEEIFGDWYVTDQKIGGRSGALTYGQANQYLADYGAPTMDRIEAFLQYMNDERGYGDAENGPSPRDLMDEKDPDDAKFEAQKQYDYHTREYERLMKSQGWHGGASGTEVYNRDWKKEAANHKREAAKFKKQAGITEGKQVDNQGRTCAKCKKGKYEETSIHDDWDGVLHCNKCNHEVSRYVNLGETASGGATGAGAIATAPMGSKPTPKSRKKTDASRKKK